MLEGVTSGLAYLHSREVVHGDLTSSNILIDDDHNPRLIDFGLASSIGPLQPDDSYLIKKSSAFGSLRWMAPEILSGNKLVPSADMYSFGCIMLEVLSGEIPFQGEGDTRVIFLKVKENKLPHRPVCATLETRHWEFITRCWSKPQERPTARDALLQVVEF
ncbi:kinase-like domain-containing protein [Chiua virens]|nr:kinase-like domain-containing protein [Chiua virens]